MTKPLVNAYPGYYVNMDNIIPLIAQLIKDAETRKTKVILVGGENIKMDGAIMSLRAIKEALYHLEVHGDLIPTPAPIKKEVPNVPTISQDAGEAVSDPTEYKPS